MVTESTVTLVPSPVWSLTCNAPVAACVAVAPVGVGVGVGVWVAVSLGLGKAAAASTTIVPLIPTPPAAPWILQ